MFFKGFAAAVLFITSSSVFAGSLVTLDVDAALRASESAKAFSASLLQSTQSDEKAVKDLEQQARQLQADLEKSKGLLSLLFEHPLSDPHREIEKQPALQKQAPLLSTLPRPLRQGLLL